MLYVACLCFATGGACIGFAFGNTIARIGFDRQLTYASVNHCAKGDLERIVR